jgi:hypothetical protein
MSFVDRTLLKTVAKFLRKKKDKSDEEAGFAQAISGSYDISSRESVMPLVNFVKERIKG